MTEPVLATWTLPAGTFGYRVPLTFKAIGGLHYIRGNHAPYFSLTADIHRKGFPEQCQMGGAMHEEIVRYFPKLADLAALHLSDIDGVPMHAESNGWYWLAGAAGGLGEKYHGSSVNPREQAPYKSKEECLAIFAKHCRINLDEARKILHHVTTVAREQSNETAREVWSVKCSGMHARWKAEAEACIEKHGLTVFGDKWEKEEVNG